MAANTFTASEAANVCSVVTIQEQEYKDTFDEDDIWFMAFIVEAAKLVLCVGVLCGCAEVERCSWPMSKAVVSDRRKWTFAQTEELEIHPHWGCLLDGILGQRFDPNRPETYIPQKEISVRSQTPPRLKFKGAELRRRWSST